MSDEMVVAEPVAEQNHAVAVREKRIAFPWAGKMLGRGSLWTSSELTTPQQKVAVLSAMTSEPISGKDMVNKDIDVVNLVVHVADYTRADTGEMDVGLRAICICADGTVFSVMGQVGLSCLSRMMQLLGAPPWEPAIPVSVKPVTTKSGGSSYQLVVRDKEYLRRLTGDSGKKGR